MKFDEFEKIIITDIIEQYPEYKQNLQAQFEKIVVNKNCIKERCTPSTLLTK